VNSRGSSRPFNLLRWFSIASLGAVVPVAALTGWILANVVTEQALQRDALLTAQFMQSCIEVEAGHIGIGGVGLAPFLDPRADTASSGLPAQTVAMARANVLEHLERLPDVLLTSLYARDGLIVWSTNPSLIGTYSHENDELEEAFTARKEVAKYHSGNQSEREEQRFMVQPKSFFLENYFPLVDRAGEPALVAEVYKEPQRLMDDIRRGEWLLWVTMVAGGLVIYLGLFSIIRRAATLLARQERELVEAESLVFMGEMATALAHSLRNPLASMRSSAELALSTQDLPVRKNAQDIITQVDFLSKWVRELLQYSRPLPGEPEPVDLRATLAAALDSFATALERAGIRVTWSREEGPRVLVEGNTTLVTQALHSVISNAVEAMPNGGEMRIELRELKDAPAVEVVISDTGVGMSAQQLASAFKPFHTNKAHGLGVGLAMLKRVAERFGGTVSLSSAENAGTQVRIRFRT